MAQTIKQGNIFGRIGSGIGKGLAEQVPKEIERNRLASGLNQLGNQQGLSPFQQFAQLSSIPGVTPQMIQSGTDLLRQQARGQALSQQNQPKPSPFPKKQPGQTEQPSSNIPSLTKEEPFAKVQEGYIPPTIEERDSIAGEAFNSNPAFFSNDPQKAIDWADAKIAQEEKIAKAYQSKHENLNSIQDNVVERLKDQSNRLNTNVPAELYSKIEDQAIQATKSKKEGGRGLTEQQAMKEYGDKLNDASRLFSKVDEIGNWGITTKPAADTLRSIKSIQEDMDKLGETDNFAKELIAKNKFSPQFAYANAQPVRKVPGLNSYIKKLPKSNSTETLFESVKDVPGTLKIAPDLAKFVKEDEMASPLAIAYELEKVGYDGRTWLQYIVDHKNELNLRQRQSEQSATPINTITPWNDWWLSSFTGIE